jgi:nitrogen fixation/metabolism regulation signal transduction histidine kinase
VAGERVSAHNRPVNIIYFMLEESCTVIGDRHGRRAAPEKAGKIFEAFLTTKPQGSGMGRANSRSIVESHGGFCNQKSASLQIQST